MGEFEKRFLNTAFQEDDFGSHVENAFEEGKIRGTPGEYFRDHQKQQSR